jgi:hypothetical protein
MKDIVAAAEETIYLTTGSGKEEVVPEVKKPY